MYLKKRMLKVSTGKYSMILAVAAFAVLLSGIGITALAVDTQETDRKTDITVEDTVIPSNDVLESSSLLKQVNTTDDAVDSYKIKSAIKKAEYEEYLESLRNYAKPDISEDEIVLMLSDSEETQIINADILDIGQEDEITAEHENVEVVDEEGVELELTENIALSYGIDVSHYQKEIDWAKVKASGIDFALIKCGGRSIGDDANLYRDSCFDDNIQGALANGIQVGIYFFSQATSVREAYEEASYCVSLIDRYQITYPVAFDWESAEGYRVNNVSISREDMTQIVEVFCDTIEGCGYQPMVYFCRNDWYNIVDAERLTQKYKTWLAVYYNEYYYRNNTWKLGNSVAEFDYKYDCWQYGVSDTVDGIDGYVDMNVAFFSYDNYEVKGLREPVLDVDYKDIQIRCGDDIDLLDNVSGVNSLGYMMNIQCNIEGTESLNTTLLPAGVYNITYSFKDPGRGIIKEKAVLTVYSNARIEISDPVPVIYVGDKYDFLKGISAYNSNGKKVVPDYLVTYNGVAVTQVKEAGSYKISYNFKDDKQGIITAIVNLTVKERQNVSGNEKGKAILK